MISVCFLLMMEHWQVMILEIEIAGRPKQCIAIPWKPSWEASFCWLPAGFLMLAYEAADLKGNDGYQIAAEFGSTGGLSIGDDVRVSGIKVGRITAQQLDPITYVAKIFMAIDPAIKIPSDSSARITQASLLGGNYLELMPGAATETLAAGAVIYDTRDPVSLSDLLGKAYFQPDLDPTHRGCPSQLNLVWPNQTHDYAPSNNAPLSVSYAGIFFCFGPYGLDLPLR